MTILKQGVKRAVRFIAADNEFKAFIKFVEEVGGEALKNKPVRFFGDGRDITNMLKFDANIYKKVEVRLPNGDFAVHNSMRDDLVSHVQPRGVAQVTMWKYDDALGEVVETKWIPYVVVDGEGAVVGDYAIGSALTKMGVSREKGLELAYKHFPNETKEFREYLAMPNMAFKQNKVFNYLKDKNYVYTIRSTKYEGEGAWVDKIGMVLREFVAEITTLNKTEIQIKNQLKTHIADSGFKTSTNTVDQAVDDWYNAIISYRSNQVSINKGLPIYLYRVKRNPKGFTSRQSINMKLDKLAENALKTETLNKLKIAEQQTKSLKEAVTKAETDSVSLGKDIGLYNEVGTNVATHREEARHIGKATIKSTKKKQKAAEKISSDIEKIADEEIRTLRKTLDTLSKEKPKNLEEAESIGKLLDSVNEAIEDTIKRKAKIFEDAKKSNEKRIKALRTQLDEVEDDYTRIQKNFILAFGITAGRGIKRAINVDSFGRVVFGTAKSVPGGLLWLGKHSASIIIPAIALTSIAQFNAFIIEELIQMAGFGLFVGRESKEIFRHSLLNHRTVIHLAETHLFLITWNLNQYVFTEFFFGALDLHKIYLRDYIRRFGSQSKLNITCTDRLTKNNVEASIYLNNNYLFKKTNEKNIDLVLGKNKITLEANGYEDWDESSENYSGDIYIGSDNQFTLAQIYSRLNDFYVSSVSLQDVLNNSTSTFGDEPLITVDADDIEDAKRFGVDITDKSNLFIYWLMKSYRQGSIKSELKALMDESIVDLNAVNENFDNIEYLDEDNNIIDHKIRFGTLFWKGESLTERVKKYGVPFGVKQTEGIWPDARVWKTGVGVWRIHDRVHQFVIKPKRNDRGLINLGLNELESTIPSDSLKFQLSKLNINLEDTSRVIKEAEGIWKIITPDTGALYYKDDFYEIVLEEKGLTVYSCKLYMSEGISIYKVRNIDELISPIDVFYQLESTFLEQTLDINAVMEPIDNTSDWRWSQVPGKDNKRMLRYLRDMLKVKWIDESEEITKPEPETIEITGKVKKLTITRDTLNKKLTFSGDTSSTSTDTIEATIRSGTDKIQVWEPSIVPNLTEVQLVIKGGDSRIFADAGEYLGDLKDGVPFRTRMKYGEHWLRVQANGFNKSIPWAFYEDTPIIPGYDIHTFELDFSTIKMTYINTRDWPAILIEPSNALIEVTDTKTNEVKNFRSQQPIVLDKGKEYLIKISKDGYNSFISKFIFDGSTLPITNVNLIRE